ncbi:MAG: ABC transporter ATP-binding protein [Clostridiales Family XIII bacterium]|jgi:NitT/TauT family transport system ATP-binding protein/sulfonate transport system ATP-binding protein|nr:ABC transporter ATP-binding protein [Clostridiales Family XIII bacterium]
MTGDSILEISGVSRTYTDANGDPVEALQDISLTVEKGEFFTLIGESGCGKTTLLRLIAGLDKPEKGTISLAGKAIKEPDPDRGYIFQQSSLFPWMTVERNIASGLIARGVYEKEKGSVAEYISLVGLEGFEKSYPHQISGGMAQRVAIARALINKPSVLLLDEPLGALDAFTRADIQDKLLEMWERERTTMILVTHDVDEAIYLSDRIVIMTPRPGKISEVIPVHRDMKLGRPRDRGSDDFLSLRRRILEKLHMAGTREDLEYVL